MCGGDLGFVYSQDAVSLWPRFTSGPLFNDLTKYDPGILVDNISRIVETRVLVPQGEPLPSSLDGIFIKHGPLSAVKKWLARALSTWTTKRPCINNDRAMADIVL